MHFLTADEMSHMMEISLKIFSSTRLNLCKTMAKNVESEPELPAVFEHSGDEGSFDGFEGRRRD